MSLKTSYTFTKEGINNLLKDVGSPFNSFSQAFSALGILIDRDTQLQFRSLGARGGTPWPGLSKKTVKTELGTWRIRYGTDKNPKRNSEELKTYKTANNLWYKPGYMKGYKNQRRYGPNSKPLVASGLFKKSFKTLKITNERLLYGTQYDNAENIMRNRPVLVISTQDVERYATLFNKWYNRKL